MRIIVRIVPETSILRVASFTFNPFQTNCFICDSDGSAVIVDPSSMSQTEHDQVTSYIDGLDAKLETILLTHAHIDHIFGCSYLAARYGVGIWMHAEDQPLLAASERQAAMFGVPVAVPPDPERLLREGDTVSVGSGRFDIIHTPGHSPGSISFIDAAAGLVISGDVLFRGSIGRTDLWRGSYSILMESIAEKILPLGDETRVLSGHGPETSVGLERAGNPFVLEYLRQRGPDDAHAGVSI